jgi:hypothetical protein
MQLKKAVILSDGHNNGSPANDLKVPTVQNVVSVMTRVSKAGGWVNVRAGDTGVGVHGAPFV